MVSASEMPLVYDTNQTMTPGDLVFTRGTGVLGQIICWISKSPWSHVKIVIDTRTIVEAVYPRVRYGKLQAGDLVMHIPYPSKADQDEAVHRAISYIGTKYSIVSLLSDFLYFCGLPLLLEVPGEYNCVELADLCCNIIPYQAAMRPADLFTAAVAFQKQVRRHDTVGAV